LQCVASCLNHVARSDFLHCGEVLPDFLLLASVYFDGVNCLDGCLDVF
jgi:hypothetical protein